jgi:hypothetical protein
MKLDGLEFEPAERARSKLAIVETDSFEEKNAVREALVTGFHTSLWMAAGFALASSFAAKKLIPSDGRDH